MCSLLLNTLAVPCGFVPANEHEMHCPNTPSCCIHRFYHNHHLTLLYYGMATGESQHQENQMASLPLPSQSPSSQLPDLVVSHNPSNIPLFSNNPPTSFETSPPSSSASPSISARTAIPNRTKSKHKCSPKKQKLQLRSSSYHLSKVSSRRRNSVSLNTRETCPTINDSVEGGGVRHILEIRHKFPDQFWSPRRQDFSLSWEGVYNYSCVNCCGTSEGGIWGSSVDEHWLKVGSQLRKIADEFQMSSLKKKNNTFCSALNIDGASVQKFVTQCFLFTFIGVIVFCKLQ